MLGNPGKAVAIILLVLQIAGEEVHSQFKQRQNSSKRDISIFTIHTYSIDALRETVGV